MGRRGIPASQLKPFSVDDPMGLGVASPSQQRLLKRFRRDVPRKIVNAGATTVARHVVSEARKAPPRPRAPTAKTQKKSSGLGCLFTLAILGALYGVGQMFIPLIVGAIEQELVLLSGKPAHGRILSVEASNMEFNEDTVYELQVEVHLPGGQPYTIAFEQALEEDLARELAPGVWVELRYDPEDLETVAIKTAGVDPPQSTPAQEPEEDEDDSDPVEDGDSDATLSDPIITREVPAQTSNEGQPEARRDVPSPASQAPQEPVGRGAPAPEVQPAAPKATEPKSAQAPKPTPEPKAAPPIEPDKAPESKPLPAICNRAASCCRTAGAGNCGSYLQPGSTKKTCSRAFKKFSERATVAGKACN